MNSDLAGKILNKDKRAIARGITIIENSNSDSAELLKKEIAENTKQLENLRYVAQKINVYPTAEEVAQLLGMTKAKESHRSSLHTWAGRDARSKTTCSIARWVR